MQSKHTYQYVHHSWLDADAAKLDGLGRLVYRSNQLGSDQRITNTGGGNTSSKLTERDPMTGKPVKVLWVKGSGGDLRTSKRDNFSALEMGKLESLINIYSARKDKGLKSQAEDDMVEMYRHCTFNLNPRASSIDTPLHAFVPHDYVDHTHPNALISIAASKNGPTVMKEVFGEELFWLPWMRPGFELGLALRDGCAKHPGAVGAIMGQHGLINWADDDKVCYERSLSLIDRAASYIQKHDRGNKTFGGEKYAALDDVRRRAALLSVLPWLRGKVSDGKRMIATVQSDTAMLRFVNSVDAPRLAELGTSCPDHFLRTKIKPMYVAWDPQREDAASLNKKIEDGLAQYRRDYAAYYERCKHGNSPAMRQPNPTVVLIPGVGMIAFGKNKSESRVTAEFYNCAVEVMRGAEAIGGYIALDPQEAFDIEYWLLEEAKLQRMPVDKAFAGRVAVVVGAGSGIGKSAANRLVPDDAHIVCVDLNDAAAKASAAEITAKVGSGIGVAGTGISGCGPAIGLSCDITNRKTVRAMFEEVVLAYGGFDDLVITAGLFVPPAPDGTVPDHLWNKTFEVNVVGPAIVVDEASRVMLAQGLDGSVVMTTSVNAVVAKKGSIAYDTSKTAANHLVRELAVTLAPHIRVNAVAPATVIEGSTMFPRDRVIASLTKYDIAFQESEPTEILIEKLAGFYAKRTLLHVAIRPEDQANAIAMLLGPVLRKTTGQVIHVDGGLADAFLR